MQEKQEDDSQRPAKKARVQEPDVGTARTAGEGPSALRKPLSVLPEAQSQLTEDLILICASGERVLACSAILLMGTESEALQEMIQLACQPQPVANDDGASTSSGGGAAAEPAGRQLSMQADKAADWLMALKLMYPHKIDRSIHWVSLPGLLRLCDKYALSRPMHEAEEFIMRRCQTCAAVRRSHAGKTRGRPWNLREGERPQPSDILGYDMPSLSSSLELLGILEQVQLHGAFNSLYELVLQATTTDLSDRHAHDCKRCPAVTTVGSTWLQRSVQAAIDAGADVEFKLSGGLARRLLSDTLELVSRYARMTAEWKSSFPSHKMEYLFESGDELTSEVSLDDVDDQPDSDDGLDDVAGEPEPDHDDGWQLFDDVDQLPGDLNAGNDLIADEPIVISTSSGSESVSTDPDDESDESNADDDESDEDEDEDEEDYDSDD